MKLLIYVLGIALMFMACAKNNASPAGLPVENIDTSQAITRSQGEWMNGPFGQVSGRVRIYDQQGSLSLALEAFSSSAGPDLHVYLSQESNPIHFIELGKLKMNQGNQVYAIPGNPDLTVYPYVLIHCQQFNHVFGIAVIK